MVTKSVPAMPVSFNLCGLILACGGLITLAGMAPARAGLPGQPMATDWIRGGHAGFVSGLAYSPDGALVASGRGLETMKLWRVSDGALLRTLLLGGTVIEFSPDGRLLLSGGAGPTVLYRLSDGELLLSLFAGEGHSTVAFSPDGSKLVTAGTDSGSDEIVRIFELDGELLHELGPPQLGGSGVIGIEFTPDGAHLVAGSLVGAFPHITGWIRVIDALTGNVERSELIDTTPIQAIDLSADGRLLATVSESGGVSLWTFPELSPVGTLPLAANFAIRVQIAPSGNRLAAIDLTGNLHVFNLNPPRLDYTLPGQFRNVRWSADGDELLLAGREENAVDRRDARTGNLLQSFAQVSDAQVGLAVAANSNVVAAVDLAGRIQVRNEASGALIREIQAPNAGLARGVGISVNGDRVHLADTSNSLRTWDVASGELLNTFQVSSTFLHGPAAFSADGEFYAESHFDAALTVWRTQDGALVQTIPVGTARIALSPTGAAVAGVIGFQNQLARIWDVDTGSILNTLNAEAPVESLAFSADGQQLALGDRTQRATVWRISDGALLHELTGHVTDVSTLAFSPDGRLLAAANIAPAEVFNFFPGDIQIQLWNLETGFPIAHVAAEAGNGVSAMVFSPDGGRLMAARMDAALAAFTTPLSGPAGDLNLDGVVDLQDLGVLLAAFGVGDAGDVDGDGDTDLADLGILLANYDT